MGNSSALAGAQVTAAEARSTWTGIVEASIGDVRATATVGVLLTSQLTRLASIGRLRQTLAGSAPLDGAQSE